jgi:hypothetical protein
MEEEDVVVYKWTLAMRECDLLISLNQLKLKVVEMTQTKVTPFQDVIIGKTWW